MKIKVITLFYVMSMMHCGLMNKGTCEQGGVKYDTGETFTCNDGCNTCTCEEDGSIKTTLIECDE